MGGQLLMSEWWTYGPRDLLQFSARTYYRLFALYNMDWWPLQLLALALALGATVLALVLRQRGNERAGRAIAAILALGWLWVAWGFHWQRYASVNLAAGYFALAFALEALLLLWFGLVRGRLTPAQATRPRAGLGLFVFALLVFPLMGPLLGRSWTQAEVFGMAPDPTALATLGVVLFAGVRPVWGLVPIPVGWCLLSGATLWAMESPDFVVVPLAALLAVGLALARRALGVARGARQR
jgi:hypothetical protein